MIPTELAARSSSQPSNAIGLPGDRLAGHTLVKVPAERAAFVWSSPAVARWAFSWNSWISAEIPSFRSRAIFLAAPRQVVVSATPERRKRPPLVLPMRLAIDYAAKSVASDAWLSSRSLSSTCV